MFGFRQRIYTVHLNPRLPRPYESARFVEEGFCFTAFFFSVLWMLYHRLWWPLAATIAVNIIIFDLQNGGVFSPLERGIVQLGIHVFIGFQANDWLRAKLARKGLTLSDIVAGESPLRAQQRYFERQLADSPAPTAA